MIVENSECDGRQDAGEVEEERGGDRLLQRLVPDESINVVLRKATAGNPESDNLGHASACA